MALDLVDKTANAFTLTNTNGVAEVTTGLPFTPNGSAADFESSSSQKLSIANDLGIHGDTVTLECWIKPESLPASGDLMDIIEIHDAGSHVFFAIRLRNIAGVPKIEWVRNVEPVAEENVFETVTLSVGTWYHLALVYDNGSTILEAFRDGVSKGTFDCSAIGLSGITDGFSLGSTPGGSRYFDGVIDEARVWNVARTVTEIANNKDAQIPANSSGLVAYWSFNALSNNYTKDFSETITMTEPGFVKAISRAFGLETLTMSEPTFTVLVISTLEFLDTITVTDVLSYLRGYFKTLSEEITMSETFTKMYQSFVTFSETINLTETFTLSRAKVFSEVISITDTIKRHLNGILISIWTKLSKPSTIWSKISKPSTIWTKEGKPE